MFYFGRLFLKMYFFPSIFYNKRYIFIKKNLNENYIIMIT